MNTMTAYICDLKRCLPWQLLLDRQMKSLYISVLEILRSVACLGANGCEVAWSGKVVLVAILRSAEACRGILCQRRADSLRRSLVVGQRRRVVIRTVVCQQPFPAHSEDKRIADAVASADDCSWECLV